MKAVKLKIGFREWDKLDDFVEMINEEADVLAYEVDSTTALLVAFGDCGMEWLKKILFFSLWAAAPRNPAGPEREKEKNCAQKEKEKRPALKKQSRAMRVSKLKRGGRAARFIFASEFKNLSR